MCMYVQCTLVFCTLVTCFNPKCKFDSSITRTYQISCNCNAKCCTLYIICRMHSSSPDLLWTSPPPPHSHLIEQSKHQTLIPASTATVSVVPAPFVGCTSPLHALDAASLAKLQQNALSSSSQHPAMHPPHTPKLSRMSFSHETSSLNEAAGMDCLDAGSSSPNSDKEQQQLFQSSQMLIHPPHKHSNSPSSTPQVGKSGKKNMLNSWRTSLRSKGRSSSGRFAASAIPPIPTVINEGMSYDESPRSPGYTTDEDVQNSKNDNSQNFEWNLNLGRRWSESVTANPKLV